MTKTEAARWAAQATRHGYFDHGAKGLEVICPRCPMRIRAWRTYQWVRARKGQPYSRVTADGVRQVFDFETERQAIRRAVVEHLLADGECAASREPVKLS